MAIHLHRSERTDVLADALAEVMAAPLADVFASELVVVPAKGVERWLSQRLSVRLGMGALGGDGICAGVEFANPHALIARLVGTDDDDPYAPDALVWPVLHTIDATLGEPWARPLAEHLGAHLSGEPGDLRRGRRYGLARRLAQHFGQYAVQRPGLLTDWLAGGSSDGTGHRLPADLAWQPPLWRELVARLAVPTPMQRHHATIERLNADPASFDLPDRVSLFGHTRIAGSELELLAALAGHRDVHLWLPHPSPALWQRLSAEVDTVPRAEDDSHIHVAHPLLGSLGRDTRELQRTLQAGFPTANDAHHHVGTGADLPTLLGHLQGDLRANAAPEKRVWDPADRSIQVHACHGIARQVEVAREVIMGLLADEDGGQGALRPALEPRDILVMCPDIDTFAPLIGAAFGSVEEPVQSDSDPFNADAAPAHPAHSLRVRLADRAVANTNALLGVALRLLDVSGSRAGASAVLDLAALLPIRARFGFTDDDIERLTTWVGQAGIRWGLDAEHRADFGLERFVQNTWRFGLDRLLAGVAMSDDSQAWVGQTLPLDDVGSSDVELAGRFTEYVDRLGAVTDQLVGSHSCAHWLSALSDGVSALTRTSLADAWQTAQLQREFELILERARQEPHPTDLRLPEVRALIAGRTAGRPTRTNFRTGTLTVCTMVPMRSVPHRVVVLLGLDDGVFPRTALLDGDDVLQRNPLTGERDPRSEDRQLLLDAIMATDETLVITYNGANEFTGQPRPPAVPLAELLDTINLTAQAADGLPLSEHVVTHHPLQPFDPRNHAPDALVPGVFSFDRTTLRAAESVVSPITHADPAVVLPAMELGDVTLADLLDFARSPMRYFLKARLDVALPFESNDVNDHLPVEVDALVQWGVGDRLLRDLLDGRSPADAAQLEWRRGVMPPGRLGWRQLQKILVQAVPLAVQGRTVREGGHGQPGRARTLDVDIDLGGGRRLRGTVPGVYGDALVPVHYSRLAGSHRLQSWINIVALSVNDPDRNWIARTLGRPTNSRAQATYSESLLGPIDHSASEVLHDLVALRDKALAEPLPLPIKSSFRYAVARRTRADAGQARDQALKTWEGSDRFPGEQVGEEFRRVLGDKAPLPGWGEGPGLGEDFPGETSRFGALAMQLWSPLIQAEAGGW